jgi:hypothetical protein
MLLRVDAFLYNLVCMLRYPVYQKDFAVTYCTAPPKTRAVAALGARAVVSAGGVPTASPVAFYSAPVCNWKNGNVYLALVENYIRHFLLVPEGSTHSEGRSRSRPLSYETELFLWLAVDFWVDVTLIINRDFSKISTNYSGNRDSNYYHHHHTQNSFAPKSCAEVTFLDANSPSPSCASMQCAYLLLAQLQGRVLGSDDAPYLSVPMMVPTASGGGGGGRSSRGGGGGKGDGMACKMFLLPRGLEILQQPMFDMLRALFTKFDTISPVQQLMAMALWLRWTQPWRFYDANSDIFGDDKCRYSIEWRPYVAANMHFYTSLFVIFLKSSVYMSAFSWMTRDAYSRDNTHHTLSAGLQHFGGGGGGGGSGSGDRGVLVLCMRLFSTITEAYASTGTSLFDDVGLLFAGAAATGGDAASIDISISDPYGDVTPAKSGSRSSTRKIRASILVSGAPSTAGKSPHARSISPSQRRRSSPRRLVRIFLNIYNYITMKMSLCL